MSRHAAGSIVVVDWRGGSLPQEPRKLRPAVVVEDHELFPEAYPTMLVVPVTRDEGLAHRSFAERIEPTADNGTDTTCWALAHHVTSVSLGRVKPTALGSPLSSCRASGSASRLRLGAPEPRWHLQPVPRHPRHRSQETDGDDLRLLARLVGVTTTEEALELVEQFYGPHRLSMKTQLLLEDVLASLGRIPGNQA